LLVAPGIGLNTSGSLSARDAPVAAGFGAGVGGLLAAGGGVTVPLGVAGFASATGFSADLLAVLLAAGLAALADFVLPGSAGSLSAADDAGLRVRPLVSGVSESSFPDASVALGRGLRGVAGGSILRLPFRIH